ncbi:MAG: proteasome accessory factor PafA2 family protein [Pirellulaceae bacterium]|nr:proteasome accessory factor PafA2 family protein [Pirellulaceae bacterium]
MALPKYGGRDCELSTTGVDADGRAIDSWTVTRHVLRQLAPALNDRDVTVWSWPLYRNQHLSGSASASSMDCLRHWTEGGQCYYADMSHLEVCTASCLVPTTFGAQCLSTLLAAEAARRRAEEAAEDGERFVLTASNADTLDPAISFGTHVSMSVEESLWSELFHEQRHPAVLGFVSSAMAALIPFFGAGYLVPLNDGSIVYSLSARAHHLSRIKTLSTTTPFERGLLNTRREPHGTGHDRLHLIGFDYCLLSSPLMFSMLQCVLAAAEEGCCRLNLFEPVHALRLWSWKLDQRTGRLPAEAGLIDGRTLTLPAYVGELAGMLLKMCEAGLITPDVAPQATEMLPRVIDLAAYAAEGSLGPCARHLTWAAKLLWLMDLCDGGGATLGDPQTRLADHDFTHTDPRRGALWRLWEAGVVDPLVTLADAEACLKDGPAESRDWGRGKLLRRFASDVIDVDWGYVELRETSDPWAPRLRINLPHLDSLNREQCEPLLRDAHTPRQLIEHLRSRHAGDMRETDPVDNLTGRLAVLPRFRTSRDEE